VAAEDSTEVTFIPSIISCDKKPPSEAITTDKTNTAVDSKPFDPIQSSLVSTENQLSDKVDLENESKSGVSRESFANRHAARPKVNAYADSFITSGTKKHSVLPKSSGNRDYMREVDESAGNEEDFSSLRNAPRPVNTKDLEEALELLKYDIHREIQEVIREQVRQFSIAKVNCVIY
jgi:flagellar capping protein FliD